MITPKFFEIESQGVKTPTLLRQFHIVFPGLTQGGADASSVVALAMHNHHPFLLRAALAVAASHLRYHASEKSTYRMSENWQQMQAITGFNEALAQTSLHQSLADALVLTSVLMNVLTFSCIEYPTDITKSWLFTTNSQLSWFSVNLGLKALIHRTVAYQSNSVLQWLYSASDDNHGTFYGDSEPLDIVPQHWKEVLGLDGTATSDALYEPARFLAAIRAIEPTPESLPLYLNFMGAIDVDFQFRGLLFRRDMRAVWLLGYWMGLLCRLDCWWTRGRATLEWDATCVWMELQVQQLEGDARDRWMGMMEELRTANVWMHPTWNQNILDETSVLNNILH